MADLRDYQQQLLDQAEAALQSRDARVMLQLPTGGGKTHIAGALLRRWLHNGRKAVWLTHRTELADQTCGILAKAGVSAIRPDWKQDSDVPSFPNCAVILMAQTVSNRNKKKNIWGLYGNADLLVVDEAHHAVADGWERAIEQWPGRVIGLTATPWRLSKTEGFDHLFKVLLPVTQVSKLQADGWLCQAHVHRPKPEEIIRGGSITAGDYTPSGIKRANRDRLNIMTAGALSYWQHHASERQTVIYAISQEHAHNLTEIFKDAEIPTAEILSKTPPQERTEAIKSFRNGNIRVLVNVAVATEGFDLPDASCVVITRPTMSLALYLQLVGRGLRRKDNDGDCLILDLAGNTEIHGLPQKTRRWSLERRSNSTVGDAPVVWCEKCDGVSPAASHFCRECDEPLGKLCRRCGKWRPYGRWELNGICTHQHEIVCDFCHLDAHIKDKLSTNKEIREWAIDPLIFDTANEVLRHLLEDSTRERELNELISRRGHENSNDAELVRLFDEYIVALPSEEQPTNNRAIGVLLKSWELQRQEELDHWNEELSSLKSETSIETKVHEGCKEQLELAGRKHFQGLKAKAIVERGKEIEREHKYFLFRALDDAERDRVNWKSRWEELGLLDKFQTKTDTDKDRHEFKRLTSQLDQAFNRRLSGMKRQFERYWPKIWWECQKSPEWD